jgi:hypothetical protein
MRNTTLGPAGLVGIACAVGLLAACGSSSPPDVGGITPPPGSSAVQLRSGEATVVSSGTPVQLIDAVDNRPWTQRRGPGASLNASDTFVAPNVQVPTEIIFSDGLSDTGILVQPRPSAACADGARCVGTSRRRVTPTQEQIDGIDENRLFVLPRAQKFNLGGFGINPTQNLPAPIDALGEVLTQPAEARVHRSRVERDEHTWLRTMVISEGDTTLVFMTLDAVGAGNIITGRITARIEEATGIPESNILFGSTHTHAGADLQGLWGGVPQLWVEEVLYPAAVASVEDALGAMRTVNLNLRRGETPQFNNYRRPQINPEAMADPNMFLLEARDLASGQPVARLLQFNAHPTSINEDPRIPHADYILGAVDLLERDGGVAVFYNGPIADASARGGNPAEDADAYERVRARGEAMASAALGFGNARTLAPGLRLRQEQAILPVTNPLFITAAALGAFNRYYNFTGLPLNDIPFVGDLLDALPQVAPVAPTAVSRVTIGEGDALLEIVTLPGEATATFGQQIRDLAGDVPVMLLGLTHNSFGYILPEDEFNYIDGSGGTGLLLPFTGYEEFVSLGPLTAPLLRLQAYAPLFDIGPFDLDALPPSLTACFPELAGQDCILNQLAAQLNFLQQGLQAQCLDVGGPEAFCGLLNPNTPLAPICESLPILPPALCSLLGEAGNGN